MSRLDLSFATSAIAKIGKVNSAACPGVHSSRVESGKSIDVGGMVFCSPLRRMFVLGFCRSEPRDIAGIQRFLGGLIPVYENINRKESEYCRKRNFIKVLDYNQNVPQ